MGPVSKNTASRLSSSRCVVDSGDWDKLDPAVEQRWVSAEQVPLEIHPQPEINALNPHAGVFEAESWPRGPGRARDSEGCGVDDSVHLST